MWHFTRGKRWGIKGQATGRTNLRSARYAGKKAFMNALWIIQITPEKSGVSIVNKQLVEARMVAEMNKTPWNECGATEPVQCAGCGVDCPVRRKVLPHVMQTVTDIIVLALAPGNSPALRDIRERWSK